MALANLKFNSVKLTDSDIVSAVRTISNESPLRLEKVEIFLLIGGNAIESSFQALDNNKEFQSIISLNSELIDRMVCRFDHNLTITIKRLQDKIHDEVIFNSQQVSESARTEASKVLGSTRQHLKAIDATGAVSKVLGEEFSRFYEARETNLIRLEKLSESMFYKHEEFIRKHTDEILMQKKILELEHARQSENLQKEYEERIKKIEDREKVVEKRLADIEHYDSKYARRQLRRDLKEELKKRSEKFELTTGTKSLRAPIFIFTIVLLCFFGVGTVVSSFLAYMDIFNNTGTGGSSHVWPLIIKQLAFTAVFASTSVFFIRWNNRWFEQHATEEFRLKRHEIDLDRASWVVEMALEWQKEKGDEIPVELIEKLSQNLFSDDKAKDYPLHPSDQLASAIFGASAGANLKLPGGTEINLDRKSVKELSK